MNRPSDTGLVFSSSPLPSPFSFLSFFFFLFSSSLYAHPRSQVTGTHTHHPIQPLGPWRVKGRRRKGSGLQSNFVRRLIRSLSDAGSSFLLHRDYDFFFYWSAIIRWPLTPAPFAYRQFESGTNAHTHTEGKRWWIKITYLRCLFTCHTWSLSFPSKFHRFQAPKWGTATLSPLWKRVFR